MQHGPRTLEETTLDRALLVECRGRSPNIGAIDRLVNAGADVNTHDEDGNTPLHLVHHFQEVLRYFITRKGINLCVKNNMGETPLHQTHGVISQILIWEGERGEHIPSYDTGNAPDAVTAAVTRIQDRMQPMQASWCIKTLLSQRFLEVTGDIQARAVLPLVGDMHGLDGMFIFGVPGSDMITQAIAKAPSSLSYLGISNCRGLTALPDLHHLTNLRVFRCMWCNRLKALPASVGTLPNLRTLSLRGGESLTVPPSKIVRRTHWEDADAALKYMVNLAMRQVVRLLIALWGEERRRRRVSLPPMGGSAELSVWGRVPREALANILRWLH